MEIVAIILSGFLFYFFNELEDECVRNTWRLKCEHLNNWLNHKTSAQLKWLSVNNRFVQNTSRLWYCLWLYKPDHKEAFPYSTTIFVWLTDGEHFFQLLKIVACAVGFFIVGQSHALYFLFGVLSFATIKTIFLKRYLQ